MRKIAFILQPYFEQSDNGLRESHENIPFDLKDL